MELLRPQQYFEMTYVRPYYPHSRLTYSGISPRSAIQTKKKKQCLQIQSNVFMNKHYITLQRLLSMYMVDASSNYVGNSTKEGVVSYYIVL